MNSGGPGGCLPLCAALAALIFVGGTAGAGDATPGASAGPRPSAAPNISGPSEIVQFADPGRAPVRVVRGHTRGAQPQTERTEIVSFANGTGVTVLRGGAAAAPQLAMHTEPPAAARTETVTFADPSLPAVTVVRGASTRRTWSADLFGPASGGELDRVAFAVDGVESRHGGDPRMWRPELDGPQGPMQVSAKAAIDVGGGDRFDVGQNRLLGRAYLAQMFRRYGNWADALAAYNWGPGNVDAWIAGGRNREQMPLETTRYISRVMHDALIGSTAAGL